MTKHPSFEELLQFLRARPEHQDHAVALHVCQCPTCQGEIEALLEEIESPLADELRLIAGVCDSVECSSREASSSEPHENAPADQNREASPNDEEGSSSTGNTDQHPDFPGYEVLEFIREGGMGVVYKARHTRLQRIVALKTVKTESGVVRPADCERFEIDPKAMAAMQHPNILQIFDVDELDGRPFFAMEYVEGRTLKEKIGGVPQPEHESARLVKLLAEAVREVHEKGVIHRDLKPQNVLMCGDTPKITDFGLAKFIDTTLDLTQRDQVVGTPEYMAPEQAIPAKKKHIGRATDVYGLGAALYEMLTGRPPFTGDSTAEIVGQVANDEPIWPRRGRLRPSLNRDLEAVCMKCLEKDPRRRFRTAEALAEDLGRFLRGETTLTRPATLAGRFWRKCKRNRTVSALVAVAILMLVMGTGFSTYFAIGKEREAENARRQELEAEDLAKLSGLIATVAKRKAELLGRKTAEAEANAEQLERALYVSRLRSAQSKLAACDIPGAKSLLLQCPLHLRGWEHSYLWSMCQSTTRKVRGHSKAIHSVSCSRDGRHVATGSADHTIRIWDADTGKVTNTLRGHEGMVSCVAFSPDGKRLASASQDNTVIVWDTLSGDQLHRLAGHEKFVRTVAFSSDGLHIASGSADGTVRLWDATSGRELRILTRESGDIIDVAFSPNGDRLVSFNSLGEVHLWACVLSDGPPLTSQEYDSPSCVAFSPDGSQIVSGGWPDAIRLWDATTGKQLSKFGPRLEIGAREVVFSKDGKKIHSICTDGTIRIWDAKTEKQEQQYHPAVAWCGAFCPDETRVFLGGLNGVLEIWDFPTGENSFNIGSHMLGKWPNLAFSPDGRRVVRQDTDDGLKIWDTATGHLLHTLSAKEERVICLEYSPDGRIIVCGSGGEDVTFWDSSTGKGVRTLSGHKNGVFSVAFSRDGRYLAVGEGSNRAKKYEIRIWDVLSGEYLKTLAGHSGGIHSLAYSHDGRFLASASRRGNVKIWDVTAGQEIKKLDGRGKHAVCGVAFSRNDRMGERKIVSCAGTAKVWGVDRGQYLFDLDDDDIQCAAFSPDNSRIATGGSDNIVRIWDASTGGELLTLTGHRTDVGAVWFSSDGTKLFSGDVNGNCIEWNASQATASLAFGGHSTAVALSPDGTRIVSGDGSGTLSVWDGRTFRELLQVDAHQDAVTDIVVSCDGRMIVSGSTDKTVKVWDLASGKELKTLTGHTKAVSSVAISPDCTHVVSADNDFSSGSIKLWKIQTGEQLWAADENDGGVTCVAFSLNGRQIVAGSVNGFVRILDAASGEEVQTIKRHPWSVTYASFSANGEQVVSVCSSHEISVLNVPSGEESRTFGVPIVISAALSYDGRWLACCGGGGTVDLWDTTSGSMFRLSEIGGEHVEGLCFSADGKSIVSAGLKLTMHDLARLQASKCPNATHTQPANERAVSQKQTQEINE